MGLVSPELLDRSRYPFRREITTRFADVDPNQHINNVVLFAAFEDARVRFGESHGPRDAMAAMRTMIVANHINKLREAHYPDPLVMYVGPLSIGRTSFALACLATQGDRVCAFARSVLVCTQDGRPTPVPQSFRDALAAVMINTEKRG
jgi:acyl-CoA thioester hydrolase